jgi:hypothetical protein
MKWECSWAVNELFLDVNKVCDAGAGREILFSLISLDITWSDLEVNATILMKCYLRHWTSGRRMDSLGSKHGHMVGFC